MPILHKTSEQYSYYQVSFLWIRVNGHSIEQLKTLYYMDISLVYCHLDKLYDCFPIIFICTVYSFGSKIIKVNRKQKT